MKGVKVKTHNNDPQFTQQQYKDWWYSSRCPCISISSTGLEHGYNKQGKRENIDGFIEAVRKYNQRWRVRGSYRLEEE